MAKHELEWYVGKDFIHKSMEYHCRVVRIDQTKRHEHDPFKKYTLESFNVYSYVPLRTEINGGVAPEQLDEEYVIKTGATDILYGRK